MTIRSNPTCGIDVVKARSMRERIVVSRASGVAAIQTRLATDFTRIIVDQLMLKSKYNVDGQW